VVPVLWPLPQPELVWMLAVLWLQDFEHML
jgi:hypothetical protein